MNTEQLSHLRHSLAHLLGAATMELYPDAQLTLGPAIDDGFYYDIKFAKNISDTELVTIEAKMKELMPSWKTVTHREVSKDEALAYYKGNQFKEELINEIADRGEKITLYTMGDFTDLCRGGHADDLSVVDPESFKLDRLAGAYWRGKEKNPVLTRIYGLAFESKEKLNAHLAMLEEAKKRDHRKLGIEMDLFTFSPLVGAGLPLYTPRGTILREELAGYSESLQKRHGFQKVWIPHITKTDLYKKSGHWDKFGGELMLVKSQESSDEFVLKPMNCPHHAQIYASKPRSYRDLPLRLMETTTCYRDEKTGELSGLTRVRSLTQDDAHVFCRIEQVEQEFESIMSMIKELYGTLNLNFHARLSFSDPATPEKYLGSKENWEMAEKSIEAIAKKLELNYFIAPGEAAFYGPKIDIMVTDALGREWQCATQQLDFVQPTRFELEYTDSDGTKKTPVMIHKALLGTIDRFLGVFIEHTAGNFPLWLAPTQIAIVPVREQHEDAAKKLAQTLTMKNIRVEILVDGNSLGKRIHAAKSMKVPYTVVLGDKEIDSGIYTIELRDGSKIELTENALITRMTEEISTRTNN